MSKFYKKDSSFKSRPQKVILAGGTGQIGQVLEKEYFSRGYKVLILTRAPQKTHHIYWDGESLGSWRKELEESDLLINLSGCSILSKNRRKIYDSRINSTKILGKAIEKLNSPPQVWLQMSAAGIYAHRLEGFDDEYRGQIDSSPSSSYWGFITNLIQDWEQAFYSAFSPKTRKVVLRMSFFMSAQPEGFFGICSRLARRGLGGSLAGGEQFISWIHERDFISGIDLILKERSLESPVNFSSPYPLPQKNLMRVLRKHWKVPFGFPVGKRMLKIAGFFGVINSDLVLKSSKAYPEKLLKHGFDFLYPEWEQASQELVQRYQKLWLS